MVEIKNILKEHNENNYGDFIKNVCSYLSTWDDNKKWNPKFQTLEYNKDNNPFIFKDGTKENISGFDFAFNDVQEILYDKYENCVFPETFLECQRLFKRINDISNDKDNGLFNQIASLHEDDDLI